jgi:hypothetical protein
MDCRDQALLMSTLQHWVHNMMCLLESTQRYNFLTKIFDSAKTQLACRAIDFGILCYFKCKSQRHRIGEIEKGAWMPFCCQLRQGSCHVGFVDIIIQWSARADSPHQR